MGGKLFTLALLIAAAAVSAPAQTAFHVRYVSSDVAYIDGGSVSGLAEGMRLQLKRPGPGESAVAARVLAELTVISVASTSAACEIKTSDITLQPGDTLYLSTEDAQLLEVLNATADADNYAQVVSFTEGDPIEEEARENVPRPPLAEINRVGGRITFEHDSIMDRSGIGLRSHQEGVVFRLDMTRIGGSHWNLSGYWRGRLNTRQRPVQQETLRDVVNRVYHIGLRYENPSARYVAGFGRLLVPWASSLSTIDGGYLGRRLSPATTIGVFAGSTPDPSAWNYDPNRQIAGTFASIETGDFAGLRQTSTFGVAITRNQWRPERQYLFSENGLIFKRYFSIQNNLEVDYLSKGRFSSTSKAAVSRSFSTLRMQPWSRLSLDLNHNYFRVLPTFDARLLASGFVDNLLFQGLSAGARVDFPLRITPYATIGRSRRNEDARSSWNRMFGVTLQRIPKLGIRVDARYSRFQGALGGGNYRSVSVLKEIADVLRFEIQAGNQAFQSALTPADRSRFVSVNSDWFVGRHYTIGFAASRYRGELQNYDQFLVNLGYRF